MSVEAVFYGQIKIFLLGLEQLRSCWARIGLVAVAGIGKKSQAGMRPVRWQTIQVPRG